MEGHGERAIVQDIREKYHTKIDQVKAHLLKLGSITPKASWKNYGYMRLADGIMKLKRRGLPIRTEKKVADDGAEYALYVLEDQQELL